MPPSPMLRRTLGEQYWMIAEDEFRRTGKPVLALKDDRTEFWVVWYNGRMARKCTEGNDTWIEYSMFHGPPPARQS